MKVVENPLGIIEFAPEPAHPIVDMDVVEGCDSARRDHLLVQAPLCADVIVFVHGVEENQVEWSEFANLANCTWF